MKYTEDEYNYVTQLLIDEFKEFAAGGFATLDDDLREECFCVFEFASYDPRMYGSTDSVHRLILSYLDEGEYEEANKLLQSILTLYRDGKDTDYRIWFQPDPDKENEIIPMPEDLIDQAYERFVKKNVN